MIKAIPKWLTDSAKDYVGRAMTGLVFGSAIAAVVSFLVETVRTNLSVGAFAPGQLSAGVFPVAWFALIALSIQSKSTGSALMRLIVAMGVVAGLVVLFVVLTWILIAAGIWED